MGHLQVVISFINLIYGSLPFIILTKFCSCDAWKISFIQFYDVSYITHFDLTLQLSKLYPNPNLTWFPYCNPNAEKETTERYETRLPTLRLPTSHLSLVSPSLEAERSSSFFFMENKLYRKKQLPPWMHQAFNLIYWWSINSRVKIMTGLVDHVCI